MMAKLKNISISFCDYHNKLSSVLDISCNVGFNSANKCKTTNKNK